MKRKAKKIQVLRALLIIVTVLFGLLFSDQFKLDSYAAYPWSTEISAAGIHVVSGNINASTISSVTDTYQIIVAQSNFTLTNDNGISISGTAITGSSPYNLAAGYYNIYRENGAISLNKCLKVTVPDQVTLQSPFVYVAGGNGYIQIGNDPFVYVTLKAAVPFKVNDDDSNVHWDANENLYTFVDQKISTDMVVTISHVHDFTYSTSDATITATCGNTGCSLTGQKANLVVVKPARTTYGGTESASATLTGLSDFNTATSKSISENDIKYYQATKSGTTYTKTGSALTAAPTSAGDYVAELELTGVKTASSASGTVTASVGYTIAKNAADPLSPQQAADGVTIDYAAETVNPGDGFDVSVDGSEKATTLPVSIAEVLNNDPKIFVRRAETDNTAAGDWVEVTLASRPAAPSGLTVDDASSATASDGKINGTTSAMEYSSDGGNTWTAATDGGTSVASGTYLVRTKATGDAPAGRTTEVTVGSKQIVLSDDQKPTAKADLVATGSEQALLNAPATPVTGGTMKYAIGTDTTTAPTSGWSESIPKATDAGTYYVWYKAFGDDNHTDSDAGVVSVTISEEPVTPEVRFDVTTMELESGQTGTIAVTVEPSDAVVTWSSDKETVATVDNTGKVTAVGAGTAKITATITVAGTQYKAECTVTVQEEPVTPEVKFDVTTMDLKSGQTGTIAVTVEPSDAVVTWSSDKETVATVDNTGKVTAVGAGTAKITATITVAGTQYKAECTVTVAEEEPSETNPVISIDDLPDAIDGESYNYTLTAGGVQPITWSITAGSLPAGLSLESESGKISGTPTSTGTSTFTVTATNTYGSTSKEMSITVQAGSTVVDTEGSAPDDQKTAVESDPSVVRDIVGDAAGGVTESDNVRLILTTDSKDEGSISGEEKEAVDAIKGAAEGSGLVVGTFVDLTLSYEVKNANGEITSSGRISQTARPLTVKFPIPAGLQKAGRLFKIFRYHGSNASEIGSGSGDAVDVSTDLFSIYAIAYTDDAAPDVPEGEESSEQPHVHTFAWDTRNATADTDGEMRYQCTKCGMIQTRVPISAYYIFNKETTEKIRAAKQGETVKIETRRWISFHKMVAEALAERKDVTVEVSFLDQGHKGNPYTFTIPAGTDLTPLFDESGFAGFMYLGNKFGMTAEGN